MLNSETIAEPALGNGFLAEHVRLLTDSYRRWTGHALVAPGLSAAQQAREIWFAPFVVASHGTQSDPVFNYGNRAALALFEASWAAFVAMPSRLSAAPLAREERQRLLAEVTSRGYVDDYAGVRVSTGGRRFRIVRATVWNVVGPDGEYRGQAVMFRDWQYV